MLLPWMWDLLRVRLLPKSIARIEDELRIIFLVSSLGAGGAERVATTLCNEWAGIGHEVYLVATFVNSKECFYNLSENVNLRFVSELMSDRELAFGVFGKLSALRRFFIQSTPNVIVSFLSSVNVLSILARVGTGVPLIVSERVHPETAGSNLIRYACRILYRFPDLLVVQTARAASRSKKIYKGLKRLMVIPNPLPEQLNDFKRPVQGFQGLGCRLVFVGRLTEQKRPDMIIRAFARCAGRLPNWQLDMFGEGPMKASLAELVGSLGLRDRVRLLGQTADPWAEISASNVFVMASDFEGFPNSLLEALCLGTPSVATDCLSGPRELTDNGRTALLVNVGDEVGLSEAMENLMSDEELRANLGESAASFVKQNFNIENILSLWNDALFAVVQVQSANKA